MGLRQVSVCGRLNASAGRGRGGFRIVPQLAVVLDLVLEVDELLDDLLALGLLLGVIGPGDGLVDVVDGAGLPVS